MPTNCPGFVSALVLRCARDDRAALGTLVDLLYAPVSAAVGGTGRESDELVADVFRAVWSNAHRFPRDENAVVWVLELARTTVHGHRVAVAV